MSSPLQIKSNDRIALVGATGSGKTFFAARLLAHTSRLVVIDPKNTLRGKWGLGEWTRKSERALISGDPVRVRFSPEPGGEWRYDRIIERVYMAGGCSLYIDEVYGVVQPGKKPPPYFTAVYTRGRELGIGVIAATQRPAWVPLFILSEANWFVAFRLMMEEDRKRMAGFMGRGVLQPIEDEHGFYIYSAAWRHPTARYFRSISNST
jgi:hypothetical protein